jgi:hypothetical protein
MLHELERIADRTPAHVVEALTTIGCERNLLSLEEPDEFLHDLRLKGLHDVAAYFTNNLTDDPFDWDLYDSAVVAVLVEQRRNGIQ